MLLREGSADQPLDDLIAGIFFDCIDEAIVRQPGTVPIQIVCVQSHSAAGPDAT